MADTAPGGGTFRLIYRSRDLIPAEGRKVELGDLFSGARSNNKRLEVTGALLLSGGWFVQVLEGDETVVRTLFEHIAQDSRHDSVTLLDAQPVAGRLFGRWSMAKVSRDGEPDIPLIADTDGIAAAANRRITAEQEAVLAQMRNAARGDAHAV